MNNSVIIPNNQKHAYLIMCHEFNEILCTLLRMIDNKSNDIYIHIDGKCQDFSHRLTNLVRNSYVFFIKDRVNVFWAHYSQVEGEYRLFRDAYVRGYLRYHLLSGVDLPIKSQKYIHNFCNRYPNKEFLGAMDIVDNRTKRIVLFPKCQRTDKTENASKTHNLLRYLNYPFDLFQVYLNYPFQIRNNMTYKMGPNWCSLTNKAVGVLIENKDSFLKTMKKRSYTDEMWKQTIIINKLGIDCLYHPTSPYQSCMRLIDWKRGKPYSYTIKDLDEIKKSDKLFCRKIKDVDLAHTLESIYS